MSDELNYILAELQKNMSKRVSKSEETPSKMEYMYMLTEEIKKITEATSNENDSTGV